MSREGNQIAPHLSATQIDAYLNEDLAHHERHQLEKHLLECQFCSDAVEGISESSATVSASMEKLESRLQKKIKSNESSVFSIWRVAAAVTVLAAGTYFIYNLTGQTEQTEQTDQILSGREGVLNNEAEPIASTIDSVTEESSGVENLIAQKETESEEIDQQIATKPLAEEQKEENLVAMAETDINQEEESEEVETDESGLGLADLSLSEPADQTFFDSAKAKQNFTSLELARAKEPEIISNKGAPKQAITLSEEIQQNVRIAYLNMSGFESLATPVDGMDNLEDHIVSSMNYPQEARDNQVTGYVILKFTVTDSGNPENVIVDQSLGAGCDEEAIRLIQIGPKWTPAKDSTGNAASDLKLWMKFPASIKP